MSKPVAASERDALSAKIANFCGLLRSEHGFGIGHREAHDGLRAIDIIGITDRGRVRSALRLICCASETQTRIFDRAFDTFFDAAPSGIAQPAYHPRHTRPGPEKPAAPPTAGGQPSENATPDESDSGSSALERRTTGDPATDADGWQALRARYSPLASRGTPFTLDVALAAALRPAADALLESIRLGRSRRWRPAHAGGRFDLRRTIRASLETGGDPIRPRYLAHPPRNPRVVVLIDGSRSMGDYTAAITAFAAALCDRTLRAHAFVFSTQLRDVTRALRAGMRSGEPLAGLGEAWGGGTKIGANVARFVDAHAGRMVSRDTLIIIFSDGLDAGDVTQLERALAEIDRRSAGIVWLNPHTDDPGFTPSARGMRAALRSITLLATANDIPGFERLARRVRQTPRIRGHRR